jgi:hypothetical protein
MDVFGRLFGHDELNDITELLPAIDRAVTAVEPLLKQISSYPHSYRKPVAFALQYARSLAASLPGPVLVSRETYAKDAFVHALFPAMDTVSETLCSSMAIQDYRHNFPASNEIYALMGMRRNEKTVVGMEMSGQTIQRDVVQKAVYFTSHTLESPSPSEQQARDQVLRQSGGQGEKEGRTAQTAQAVSNAGHGYVDGPFAYGRCTGQTCIGRAACQHAEQHAIHHQFAGAEQLSKRLRSRTVEPGEESSPGANADNSGQHGYQAGWRFNKPGQDHHIQRFDRL